MIEINLIPDVKQEFIRAQKVRNAAITFSILAGIVAGGIVVVLVLVLGAQSLHEKTRTRRNQKTSTPHLVTLKTSIMS